MSTRRTAKATTDNDSGPVRTTRSTTKVSGSSPDSKKGSSKKKGTYAKSSKSASTDSSNMQQFVNLTPEEKELMELVNRTKNKADNFESPSRKEKSRNMEIEDSVEESEAESDEELSDIAEEKESMEIVQTQLIPSVGKDSGTKSLDKTLDVQQGENESEAALEGIGALEDISELEGSPQVKAGGNPTQYMESQELTGLTNTLRTKVPAMESPQEKTDQSEKAESDMLNNINNLTEIEEEKAKEIDQEVEKELAVDTLEGDMGTFEKDDESDEGDRVIMPTEEPKDRMEEEQEQNIQQKKKELEDKQLEEDRKMIENATNIEVHSDESGETVEVIKPALITRHSQEATVLFDDKTPKSSVQRGTLTPEKKTIDETHINEEQEEEQEQEQEQEQEEQEEQEEEAPKPEPQPNQDFTGEMEEQDVFDRFIVEPSKRQANIGEIEEEKKEEIPVVQQEVYNITQEEILQNYKGNRRSRRRNQQKKQDSDDDEEEKEDDKNVVNDEEEIYEEEVKSTSAKEKAGSKSARREYAVYEDWRILESLAAFERQNGSVGLKSINTWAAIRDPLTKKKLTEIGRTAESLKTRMYKTLTLLTEEDREQITEYIQNHSKEEAMAAYCRFEADKTTKKKKFQGIFKEPSFNPSGLQRKTPYNQKPAVVTETKVAKEKPKKEKGLVEKAFEERSDDIEDVMIFLEEEEPRENMVNPNLPIISEVLDFSVEKTTPNKTAEQPRIFVAPAQANSKPFRNLKPIEKMEIVQPVSRASMISSTRTEKQKSNKKRKDYRMVSYPVAAPAQKSAIEEIGPCLKRVKTDRYFEQKSLLISDEFRIKISTEKFNPPQNDINVFVDPGNNFRQFVIVEEESQNDFNQNLIIERLSQIASKYKIRQEDVHNIFHAVSNDFDDLQLYLKTKNPFILWEPSEDQDLLGGDQTAIRYLLQLKGEERIARRRQYLMGE